MPRQDPKRSVRRCPWGESHPLYVPYHDREWGAPLHDDRKFFELLVLEAAQAGLSWLTVLKKREAYRKAFDGFDPRKVAGYDSRKVKRLLGDDGIIRNRMKIEAAIANAKAFLEVQREFGSFDAYVWQFVGGKPIRNRRKTIQEVPPRSAESDALSADLRRRGFRFVGSTICYAFMQAVGMVNDHLVSCFRHREVTSLHSQIAPVGRDPALGRADYRASAPRSPRAVAVRRSRAAGPKRD
jgi:DNA-3-methyladenine glycosylase I